MTTHKQDMIDRDLRLYGIAYRYKSVDGSEDQILDPTRITTYYKRGLSGWKVREPAKNNRARRFIRHMTQPGRIGIGFVFAALVSLVSYGPHDVFGWHYLASFAGWVIAMATWFWLYELHNWAGGRSTLD